VAHTTVLLDRTGLLRSMNLDAEQAAGELCAVCGPDESALRRIGKIAGTDQPVMICPTCCRP
jgi:hypothetical protein